MSELLGHQLRNSENVDQLIYQLLEQVGEFSQQLGGPCSASVSPGGSFQDLVHQIGECRGRPLFFPYVGTGLGRGAYVELEDGSIKLDLINGIGVHILGHSHPQIIKASLKAALSDVVIQGNLQPNREYAGLGEKLIDLASRNSRLKYVWLTTSGSMSNENALRSCRQKRTPARKIIAMESAFAGRTVMMAEVTDNPNFKVGQPDYEEVLRVPFYNKRDPNSSTKSLNQFKEYLSQYGDDICAFTFEPMQGEGGYNVAPRDFFLPMLELCRENGIPVWVDEIQTFCRTGEFFAYETLGIGDYVDVCALAKTAQNGATLYTEELNPQPGLIAGTFAGSSAALAAGCEILNILDSQSFMGPEGKINQIHNRFVSMLNELNESTCKGVLQDAGGMGLMVAVTPLDGSKEKMLELVKTLYKNGLMTFGCGHGPYRLRFLLPGILTEVDIKVAREILERSILEIS